MSPAALRGETGPLEGLETFLPAGFFFDLGVIFGAYGSGLERACGGPVEIFLL